MNPNACGTQFTQPDYIHWSWDCGWPSPCNYTGDVRFTPTDVNNTPVVVVFMPILISLAASRGLKPSKLLIPLSFASI